jgi:hypothetical protein
MHVRGCKGHRLYQAIPDAGILTSVLRTQGFYLRASPSTRFSISYNDSRPPKNPPIGQLPLFRPFPTLKGGTWSSIGNAIAYVCVGEFMRHHDVRRCFIHIFGCGGANPTTCATCALCSIPVFSPRIGTWNISIYYNLFPLGFRAVRHR